MPPRFTSFDEAWRWFVDGGELVPLAEQRERFVAGRAQFLVFHAPITDSTAIDVVRDVFDAVADIDGITPMPDEHLHISIRPVGFQVLKKRQDDEVLRQEVDPIAARAANIIKRAKPARVTIGPVNVFPDALILEVHDDAGALAQLRRDLAQAVSNDAFGLDDAQFLPHITIGWFETAEVAGALRERLPALRDEMIAVETLIRRVDLARWWFTGHDAAAEPELDVVRGYVMRG
jgi:2'-5' RNA ligase